MEQQGGGGGGESSWHNNNNNVNMRMGDRNEERPTRSSSELVESASPISSRPPQINQQQQYSELVVCNNRNRWPRQETLALLKIRSEMDATFRDATLKAPLWDHVSRKLAEVGYKRSAKKCKEKFENVHKYYKRTKEGRGGRQHGKTYKFFSELEALQASPNLNPTPMPMPISSFRSPISIVHNDPTPLLVSSSTIPHTNTDTNTISNSFSSNSSDDDMPRVEVEAEAEAEADPPACSKSHKRKRSSEDESWSLSMMEFFESLMRQVMQKQETLQQKFLDLIEKGDEERKIREEAWKRQEISRLSREHHLMAQERTISASRDAAIVSYLNKITGQTINLPNNPTPVPMDVSEQHQQPQPQDHLVITTTCASASGVDLGGPSSSSSPLLSRWPKPEVLGLIKVRSEMDCKYQEAVPKGPLWEEVSAKMQQMGYIRSAKRCKEKWENINKYFKKVKESSKKRPEDANTCPYFHQLDALYRNKQLATFSDTTTTRTSRQIEASPTPSSQSEKTTDQLMVDLCDNTDKAAALLDKKTNIVNDLKHDQPLQVDDYNEDQEQEHENQQITGVKSMCLGLDRILQREGQNMTSNEHHNHTSSAFLAIVQ